MLSVRNKFLFIHIPKTGGNSIQSILSSYSEDVIIRDDHNQDGVNTFEVRNENIPVTKHSTLEKYNLHILPEFFNSLYKFTCVRNPWDRLVSLYFTPKKGRTEWNREEFLKVMEDIPLMTSYITRDDRIDMDYIIKFESINKDFAHVCSILGIENTILPFINKSNHMHYSEYYDNELIDIVGTRYEDDLNFFGYSFETG